MIDSVVDLIEEHVDLDGSQFSESIVERWYFARISQRNVVVLEFGSPGSPRSPLLTLVMIIVNVERVAFTRRTYSRAVLRFSCVKSSNKSPRSFMSL